MSNVKKSIGQFFNKPIGACSLKKNDLQQLFSDLEEKAKEAIALEIEYAKKVAEASPSIDISALPERLSQYAKVTIVAVTDEGKIMKDNELSFFNDDCFPDNLEQITFTNNSDYKYQIGQDLQNNFSIHFDFRKPKIIDFSNPMYPDDRNQSNYNIFGASNTWATAIQVTIEKFVKAKGRKRKWLYSKNTYQFLLLAFFPFILVGVNVLFKLFKLFDASINFATEIGVCIYLILFLLFLFRTYFNYSKWCFPLVAFNENESAAADHRKWYVIILSTIVLGLVVNALWDHIKPFFG